MMSRGNGGNGNGGTFRTCDRRNCGINGGVLRKGEARLCDDRGNVTHVVDCSDQVEAGLYMYWYPYGMPSEKWQRMQRRRHGMQRQDLPPTSATA